MKKIFAIALTGMMMCSAIPAFADHTPEHRAEQKADMMFDKMDTDHDGKVTKAEHDAAGTMMFNDADTNKDGALSPEEMEAHKKMEMQKMHDQMNMKK